MNKFLFTFLLSLLLVSSALAQTYPTKKDFPAVPTKPTVAPTKMPTFTPTQYLQYQCPQVTKILEAGPSKTCSQTCIKQTASLLTKNSKTNVRTSTLTAGACTPDCLLSLAKMAKATEAQNNINNNVDANNDRVPALYFPDTDACIKACETIPESCRSGCISDCNADSGSPLYCLDLLKDCRSRCPNGDLRGPLTECFELECFCSAMAFD